MKFHGRVEPGRLTDLSTPIEIRIHHPRKASGVTIKIWELDAYIGADGKPHREGTPDDLLATFTGSIEPAPPGGRPPEWRKFVVDSVKIEEAPADSMKFLLKFPGSDDTYEIPVISEVREVEGTDYEIGFSMEVGGAEKFRTKVPCLITAPMTTPRVREIVIVGFDENGEPITEESFEEADRRIHAALGAPAADFGENVDDMAVVSKALEKVAQLRVGPAGLLMREPDKTEVPPEATQTRRGKRLRVHVLDEVEKASSDLPAALSHQVGDDGTIEVHRVDTAHRRTLFLGGGTTTHEERDDRPVLVSGGVFDGAARIERSSFVGRGSKR